MMKDLLTVFTGLVGGLCAVVLVAVVYVAIIATFGFALGLGWQAAVQFWSIT